MTQVYKLINPVNSSVFYIGITQRSLEDRLSEHLININSNSLKCATISVIKQAGLLPIIELSEVCKDEDAKQRENFWIDFYNLKQYQPKSNYRHPSYEKPVKYTVSISKEIHERLLPIAEEEERNINKLVNIILKNFLNKEEDKVSYGSKDYYRELSEAYKEKFEELEQKLAEFNSRKKKK